MNLNVKFKEKHLAIGLHRYQPQPSDHKEEYPFIVHKFSPSIALHDKYQDYLALVANPNNWSFPAFVENFQNLNNFNITLEMYILHT